MRSEDKFSDIFQTNRLFDDSDDFTRFVVVRVGNAQRNRVIGRLKQRRVPLVVANSRELMVGFALVLYVRRDQFVQLSFFLRLDVEPAQEKGQLNSSQDCNIGGQYQTHLRIVPKYRTQPL